MNIKIFLLRVVANIKKLYFDVHTKFINSSVGVYILNLNPRVKKVTYGLMSIVCVVGIVFLLYPSIFSKSYNMPETYIPPDGAIAVDYAPDTIVKGQELKVIIPKELTLDPSFSFSIEPNIKFTSRNEGNTYYVLADQTLADNSEIAVVVKNDKNIYVDYVIMYDVPKILQMYPSEGAVLDAQNNISIILDKPVVSLMSVSKQMNPTATPKISPSIEGTWQWMGTDTLQFVPKTEFNTSTKYTITFNDEYLDFDGSRIHIPELFKERSFFVQPIELSESISPESVTKPYVLKYNVSIDVNKTKPEITLESSSGKKILTNVTIKENTISVIPKENSEGVAGFDFGENYTLTVNKVFPKVGNFQIDTPQVFTINIANLVRNSYGTYKKESVPTSNDDVTIVYPNGEIHLIMNEEVDINSLVVDHNVIARVTFGKK